MWENANYSRKWCLAIQFFTLWHDSLITKSLEHNTNLVWNKLELCDVVCWWFMKFWFKISKMSCVDAKKKQRIQFRCDPNSNKNPIIYMLFRYVQDGSNCVWQSAYYLHCFFVSTRFYVVPWELILNATSCQTLDAILDYVTHLASMSCWYRFNGRQDYLWKVWL